MGDGLYWIDVIAQVVVMIIIVICLILSVVMFISKMY